MRSLNTLWDKISTADPSFIENIHVIRKTEIDQSHMLSLTVFMFLLSIPLLLVLAINNIEVAQ